MATMRSTKSTKEKKGLNQRKKKNDKADIRAGDVLITRGVSEFQSSANPYLQMHKISQGPEKL